MDQLTIDHHFGIMVLKGGWNVNTGKGFAGVTHQETRFAHVAIAYHHAFDVFWHCETNTVFAQNDNLQKTIVIKTWVDFGV